MAKNIYIVTMADGTTQEFTAKKAFKKLEGIVSVLVNGEDKTNEFVQEGATMAKEIINNEVIEDTTATVEDEVVVEDIEVTTPAVTDQEAPVANEGPELFLYVKAARDGSKLYWDVLEVEGFQMGMTFKEIEALIPNPVHAGERNVIFVSMARVKAFIEEGKQYGIKTTNKDLTKNYNKIMGTEFTVAELTDFTYKTILSNVELGITNGTWDAPIDEPAEEAEVEVDTDNIVEDEEFVEAV